MQQEQANEDNDSNVRGPSNESNQLGIAGPSDSGAGAASTSALRRQGQTAAILKLDIDCCEEAFDFLRLKDLINVGNTCKRLNNVIGFILHEYYPGLVIRYEDDGILMGDHLKINHLVEYIQKIQFSQNLGCFENIQSKCHRLQRIDFHGIRFTEPQIDAIKLALKRVKYLRLANCAVNGDFYKSLLKFCPKIKTLSIMSTYNKGWLVRDGKDWMKKSYPTLEHFVCNCIKITELKTLLKLNQNIRKLSVTDDYINRYAYSCFNIKLDELEVMIKYIRTGSIQDFIDQLNALYERGFYQRLKLYIFDCFKNDDMHQLARLNGLVAFYRREYSSGIIRLSNLTGLKDFYVHTSEQLFDLPTLPTSLPNLERIQFMFASIDDILPFIRQSMNLEQIKIDYIMDGNRFVSDSYVINLVKLNQERARLEGAEKTTIYVKEEIYLATKWTLKETDYTYVRLKRIDSYEWDNIYAYFY